MKYVTYINMAQTYTTGYCIIFTELSSKLLSLRACVELQWH